MTVFIEEDCRLLAVYPHLPMTKVMLLNLCKLCRSKSGMGMIIICMTTPRELQGLLTLNFIKMREKSLNHIKFFRGLTCRCAVNISPNWGVQVKAVYKNTRKTLSMQCDWNLECIACRCGRGWFPYRLQEGKKYMVSKHLQGYRGRLKEGG